MRSDVPAPTAGLARVQVTVTLHKTATIAQIIAGTASGGVELGVYAESVSHSSTEGTVRFRHHDQLDDVANNPLRGDRVVIGINSYIAFAGIVAKVQRVEARGVRTITVTLRDRGSFPLWRKTRRVTESYARGTSLSVIAEDVCEAVGLGGTEFVIPSMGINSAHDYVQLADQSAWEMLELLLGPALLAPFINAKGQLKTYNRAVIGRTSDIVLTEGQYVSSQRESLEFTAPTQVLVKWLSPTEEHVRQVERVLAQENVSVGFFSPGETVDIRFSSDETLRADNVWLDVKKSVNIIPDLQFIGQAPMSFSESFTQDSPYGGHLTVLPNGSGHALLLAAFVSWQLLENVPLVVGAFGAGVAARDPVTAVALGLAQTSVFTLLSLMGNGIYEIRGTPYDVVFPVHELLCWDQDADTNTAETVEVRNDFLEDQAAAETFGVNELCYRVRASSEASLVMQDDLRVEPGDVIELPDGSQFYVEDYTREISRPSEATLAMRGFFL